MKKLMLMLKASLFVAVSMMVAEHTAEDHTLSQSVSSPRSEPALVGKSMSPYTNSPQRYTYDDKIQHHDIRENNQRNAKRVDNEQELNDDEMTFRTMPYTPYEALGVDDFKDVDNDDINAMADHETPEMMYHKMPRQHYEDLEQEEWEE